jgi:hypothetical protein
MVPAQFAHQITRLQFPKDVHFGDDISIWIAKAGDVAIGSMYLRVAWPVSCTVDDSAGTRMIDFVELRHENELLERHYGETIEIMNDLTVPQAKQGALQQLTGKGITTSLQSYYIKMPFKLNLPLCALDTPPIFRIKLRPTNEFSSINFTKPIQVDLFVDYVYVTKAERDYFKKTRMDYLTHTMQRLVVSTSPFLTEFTRPVKELYWVIQTVGASSYDFTNNGSDQLVSLNLRFDGNEIIKDEFGTPMFMRIIQGLENHTRVPDRYFYMHSFALDPEHPDQPTGELDMSAVTRQLHTLTLSPSTSPRQIRVYALTHNIIRLENGLLKNVFSTTGTI